jgi:arabinan endo-1,5-alpha-L-arabinosidase
LIDPFVFWDSAKDPNGPAWFTFGSYWSGIQQIQMGGYHDLTAWKGKDDQIRNVLSNTTAAYAVQEGATYHREGKWIYAFFSVGQCCRRAHELMPPGDEYRVVVCRGESPTGPYHDKDGNDCLTENGGTTVLASHGDIYAPGGQGVMLDPKSGRTVMYYHYGKRIGCVTLGCG